MGLKKRTSKGIFFRKISVFTQAGIEFLVTVILAKLLAPTDFGLIAIASLFTIFISRINELGLGQALIQKQKLSYEEISTSFWLNLASGLIFFALIASTSPLTEAFFKMPGLAPLLAVLSINLILSALSVIPRTLLEKKLEFKKLAYFEIKSIVIFAAAASAFAYYGFGAFSIVYGRIAQRGVMLILLWRGCDFAPSTVFDFNKFRKLLRFGINVMLEEIVSFFYANTDYIVIGKLLGATALGYYTIAYQIVTMPNQKISIAILSVIYPAFCQAQGDNAKLKSGFLKVVRYLSLIIFPVLTGYLAVSDILILSIFCAKWQACILPSQILVVAGMTKAVGAPISSIFKSKGRPDISLKFNLASFALTLLAIFALVRYGIAGIAAAVLIASVISFLAAQYVCNIMLDSTYGEYLGNLKLSLISSVTMSALVFGIKRALLTNTTLGGLPLLAALVVTGILIYLILLYIIDKSVYKEVSEIYKEVRT